MESDKTVYYQFKYLPFFVGLFFFVIVMLMHLYPENSTVDGEPGPPDSWTTAILILSGILICLIPFLYIDKLVLVHLSNQRIEIKDEEDVAINWQDVESLSMVPLIFPPLYKLRLKNQDGYYLFNTTRWGIHFLGFTWDWSDMGRLIRRKKQELGI